MASRFASKFEYICRMTDQEGKVSAEFAKQYPLSTLYRSFSKLAGTATGAGIALTQSDPLIKRLGLDKQSGPIQQWACNGIVTISVFTLASHALFFCYIGLPISIPLGIGNFIAAQYTTNKNK